MNHRLRFRVIRWIALFLSTPVICACLERSLAKPALKPEATFAKTFQQSLNRNVDLLFMVDDSSSMKASQTNLLNNFPSFMNALQSSPQGLPNIHVAVVSQDLGAGYGDIGGCSASGGQANPGGDKGIFQYTARGSCTATNLQPGATFISNVAGQANYTGNLADVFTCIAALGDQGCGFEHQFGSVLRALGADGHAAPSENQGFLRPEAYLAVVLITNEDDCSSAVEPQFFDITSNWNQGSQLGESFRCNEFGHLCSMGGGPLMHPNRNAPNNDVTAMVAYDMCISDDSSGYLLGATDTANRLKALKADPSQVIVAAITGPAQPYVVHWINPLMVDTSCGAASCPWPVITHSCMAADGSFADPSVRIAQFVDQFGANGLLLPICDQSFAPSLGRLAQLINASLLPPCVQGQVAMIPGTQNPDCTVVSHTSNGTGGLVDSTVPACSQNGGAAPCWQLQKGMCAGGNGQTVAVSADPNVSSSNVQNATVNCALCITGTPDPARGCP